MIASASARYALGQFDLVRRGVTGFCCGVADYRLTQSLDMALGFPPSATCTRVAKDLNPGARICWNRGTGASG